MDEKDISMFDWVFLLLLLVFLLGFFFLVVLRPTRKIFFRLETSQLPEKGCKC